MDSDDIYCGPLSLSRVTTKSTPNPDIVLESSPIPISNLFKESTKMTKVLPSYLGTPLTTNCNDFLNFVYFYVGVSPSNHHFTHTYF